MFVNDFSGSVGNYWINKIFIQRFEMAIFNILIALCIIISIVGAIHFRSDGTSTLYCTVLLVFMPA